MPGGGRAKGSSRSTASPRGADHLIAVQRSPSGLRERSGLAAGRRLGCHARVLRRPRDPRAAREPGPPAGRPQGGRRARDRDRSGRAACTTSRSRARPRRTQRRSPAAARGAPRRDWQLDGLSCRPPRARRGSSAPCATADGASPSPCTTGGRSRRSGRASTTWRSGSLSTSVPRRWPATSAICTPARCSRSAGAMNPQIRFGEDLMSRVSYVMMHPGGERDLTRRGPRVRRRPDRGAVRAGSAPTPTTCSI